MYRSIANANSRTYCNCGTVFSNPTGFKDFTELKEDMNVACIKDHCYVVTVRAYTEHRDLNKATRPSFMMRNYTLIILANKLTYKLFIVTSLFLS